ncbi:ABC transporter permease [Streptomyces sp. 4N509B]|uniref:ABC transporter permease n=1 Tax=Streptomyces sp. 4N509B TaxID=3457413 RepID=UPI003FD023B9
MTATAVGKAPTASPTPPSARDTALAGTWTLLRFALRRDRVRLPVWVLALWLTVVSSLSSFETSYGEPSDQAELAQTVNTPAMLAMTGPEHYLTDYNLGAITAHQLLAYTAIAVGMMSVFTVVRHTRTEEETGRAELLRSNVVGRHAQLTAAVTLATLANLVLALVLVATMATSGLDGMTTGGAWLFGAIHLAAGVLFAAVAAVAAQITPFSRGSTGMALAFVGLAFVLRAAGDTGADALSWLSPIGWVQRTYVYVDDRWWPLLIVLAFSAVALATAYRLSARRDVGGGLRPPRPGRPTASPRLATPVGLALRLQAGVLIGFAVGMLLFGMMYGSILGEAEEMLEDIDQLQESVAELGGDLTEGFASVIMSFLAIITAAFSVMTVGRARSEETGGRAEPVLATALSRDRWVGGHVAVSLAGGTLVLVLGGLGFGLAGAASVGDGELLWKLTGSALAYAPALWVTTGISLVLFGWLPRLSALAWAVPIYSFLVVYLGELIDMPDGLTNFSPVGHVPQVPAASLEWTPLLVMTVLAGVLVWLGLLGFRRRDLESK